MYEWFNRGAWDKCFSLLDPKLREVAKVNYPDYAGTLESFREAYGEIRPWGEIVLSLHLSGAPKHQDPRPFAFVYAVWQDRSHGFHMFRERWVKDCGRWFTRVVGLVPNRQGATQHQD
jgi:hypothetical protein